MSTYEVQDNSINGVGAIVELLQHFFPYAQEQLGFHKPVMISFDSDEDNASKMLGRTAHYNPDSFSIAVYVDGRHPKDILRSLSHELVHHTQNCNGDFDSAAELGQGYAQENPAMRNAELDAYKRGNIIFRDFEDLIKKGAINVDIDFENTGEPKMSLKEWKNNELNTLLMKKWGLLKEQQRTPGEFVRDVVSGKESETEEPKSKPTEAEILAAADERRDYRTDLTQDAESYGRGEGRVAGQRRVRQGASRVEDLYEGEGDDNAEKEMDEGCPAAMDHVEGGEAIDISRPGMEVHVDDISELSPEEAFAAGIAAARDALDAALGGDAPEELQEGPEAERLKQAISDTTPAQGAEGEAPEAPAPAARKEDKQEESITLDEARDVARKIFERLQGLNEEAPPWGTPLGYKFGPARMSDYPEFVPNQPLTELPPRHAAEHEARLLAAEKAKRAAAFRAKYVRDLARGYKDDLGYWNTKYNSPEGAPGVGQRSKIEARAFRLAEEEFDRRMAVQAAKAEAEAVAARSLSAKAGRLMKHPAVALPAALAAGYGVSKALTGEPVTSGFLRDYPGLPGRGLEGGGVDIWDPTDLPLAFGGVDVGGSGTVPKRMVDGEHVPASEDPEYLEAMQQWRETRPDIRESLWNPYRSDTWNIAQGHDPEDK